MEGFFRIFSFQYPIFPWTLAIYEFLSFFLDLRIGILKRHPKSSLFKVQNENYSPLGSVFISILFSII